MQGGCFGSLASRCAMRRLAGDSVTQFPPFPPCFRFVYAYSYSTRSSSCPSPFTVVSSLSVSSQYYNIFDSIGIVNIVGILHQYRIHQRRHPRHRHFHLRRPDLRRFSLDHQYHHHQYPITSHFSLGRYRHPFGISVAPLSPPRRQYIPEESGIAAVAAARITAAASTRVGSSRATVVVSGVEPRLDVVVRSRLPWLATLCVASFSPHVPAVPPDSR